MNEFYYNVSRAGCFLFATKPDTDKERSYDVGAELAEKFPASAGFKISRVTVTINRQFIDLNH